ncbi:MAG: hypothetical protein IKT82_06120 [Bacteroidaceae bacterium]|nr:hypothetical protein [Bacteroidaceae bacterium]
MKSAKKKVVSSASPAKSEKKGFSLPQIPYRWGHVLAVLLIYACCTCIYGDVFQRAQQDCYVSMNSEYMAYVQRLPLGDFYTAMRFFMLAFKNVWLGGAVMTILLVGSACCLSRLIGLTRQWKLLSFLLPLSVLGYFVWRGVRVYYLDEPSWVLGLPTLVFVITALGALIASFVRKKKALSEQKHANLTSAIIFAIASVALISSTYAFRENDIVISRMQNSMLEADWEGIAEDALSVDRGSRPVAAYYAIALVQQNLLLEELFNYAFDYPQDGIDLQEKGQSEVGLYEADCNFYAGLVNSAYRSAMDRHVMMGPTIYSYKRMMLCAILNGEKQLAKRYQKALEAVPFEGDFVARYAPMIDNPELVAQDPELAKVLQLAPRETNYEQRYRRPIFLGYNVGLTFGSDQTLITSIASTLYSKDLMRFVNMAVVLRQKTGGRLPAIVRQAILIYSMTHEEVKQAFPEICNDQVLVSNFQAFVNEARPYLKDKAELRKRLKENWLGTYYYYYYCENNEPYQVRKVENTAGGVN